MNDRIFCLKAGPARRALLFLCNNYTKRRNKKWLNIS